MKMYCFAFFLTALFLLPYSALAGLPLESQAFLDAHSDRINKIHALGGTAAIDDATVNAAEDAVEQINQNDNNQPQPGTDPGHTPGSPTFGNEEVCDAMCQSEMM